MEQITLNYESGLVEAWPTLREYVAHRVHHQGVPQKAIAADMDLSPSMLSRKCAQGPSDSARLTVDDLERFMESQGDFSPVLYLVEKYLTGRDELDRLRLRVAELEAHEAAKRGETKRGGPRAVR